MTGFAGCCACINSGANNNADNKLLMSSRFKDDAGFFRITYGTGKYIVISGWGKGVPAGRFGKCG